MLLLTIIHLLKPEERLDAFKIAKDRSKEIIKVGTTADKPNKEGTLRELGQVWHLMTLLILDESAAKNQKKAIFSFLTSKVPSTDKLFQNPFNWRGKTIPVLDVDEVVDICLDIVESRNMFEMAIVEEVLELPC